MKDPLHYFEGKYRLFNLMCLPIFTPEFDYQVITALQNLGSSCAQIGCAITNHNNNHSSDTLKTWQKSLSFYIHWWKLIIIEVLIKNPFDISGCSLQQQQAAGR